MLERARLPTNLLADYHSELLRSGGSQRGTRFSGESQLGLLCSFIVEKVASNNLESDSRVNMDCNFFLA